MCLYYLPSTSHKYRVKHVTKPRQRGLIDRRHEPQLRHRLTYDHWLCFVCSRNKYLRQVNLGLRSLYLLLLLHPTMFHHRRNCRSNSGRGSFQWLNKLIRVIIDCLGNYRIANWKEKLYQAKLFFILDVSTG